MLTLGRGALRARLMGSLKLPSHCSFETAGRPCRSKPVLAFGRIAACHRHRQRLMQYLEGEVANLDRETKKGKQP